MKILAFIIPLLLGAIPHAYAQSSPGLIYGQVPTATQWNGYFSSKQDNLNFTPLNKAGDSMSGRLVITPSTSPIAGLNISPGIAPLVPNNGDLWTTTSGIFAQIGGTTIQLGLGGTNGGAASFTTLAASGAVSGAGFTALFAAPPPIGSSAANTGSFTDLSASGTITGSGFSSLFTSLLGSGLPASFANLQSSGTVSGAGFTSLFASPPPTGSTAPNTGAFTTISSYGSSSGHATISPQANAGTPTITIPTASGTIVTNVLSPLLLNASTGQLSITSGVGAVSLNRVVFTASGTYTPTANMIYAEIECQGGGGGSGGAAGTTGASGGASGGTYSRVLVTAATVGASQTVTIGAGGTAGANTGATGGTGVQTSVGSLCTAPGGIGSGGSSIGGAFGLGAAAPAAGTGDVSVQGSPGGSANNGDGFSGNGGSATLGAGGLGCNTKTTQCLGNAGTTYGGGAGGPISGSGGSARTGSVGGAGIAIVTEYIQQ